MKMLSVCRRAAFCLSISLAAATTVRAQAPRVDNLGRPIAQRETPLSIDWFVARDLGGMDRSYAEFARLMRAGPLVPYVPLPMLLEPPYACTPGVDRLFSRSLADLTGKSIEVFFEPTPPGGAPPTVERGLGVKNDQAGITLPVRTSAVRGMIRGKQFYLALLELRRLFPGREQDVDLGLANLLLTSNDAEAIRYGRRLLEECAARAADVDDADPKRQVRAIECGLLAGHVALKELRWGDAALHFAEVAARVDRVEFNVAAEELKRYRNEARLGLVYVHERREDHERAIIELTLLLERDPTNVAALAHLGAMLYLAGNRSPEATEASTAKFARAYELARKEARPNGVAPAVLPPALMQLALQRQTPPFLRAEGFSEAWRKFVAAGGDWEQDAAAKARIHFIGALWHAQFELIDESARLLESAEQGDGRLAAASLRAELLFYLGDRRAVDLLKAKFLRDVTHPGIARMLTIVLLESSSAGEREQGTKLAELMHTAHPDAAALTVALAYAYHVHGRDDEALELIGPLLPTRRPQVLHYLPGGSLELTRVGAFAPDFSIRAGIAIGGTLGPDVREPKRILSMLPTEIRSDPMAQHFSAPLNAFRNEHFRGPEYEPPALSLAVTLSQAFLGHEPAPLDTEQQPWCFADDAYLIARILIDAERTEEGLTQLAIAMNSRGLMRYRNEAGRLWRGLKNLPEEPEVKHSPLMIVPKPRKEAAPAK